MTYEEIINQLQLIRLETAEGGNTRVRVYEALKAILDFARDKAATADNTELVQAISALQEALSQHDTAGNSHEAKFQHLQNVLEEQINQISVFDGKIDVTNLLRLYDNEYNLLVSTTDATVRGNGEGLMVTGEAGSSFTFTGAPASLAKGKYTLSMKVSDPQAKANVKLVKYSGELLDLVQSEALSGVWSIDLAEAMAIAGIRYYITARHANTTLSHISLVSGEYVGYTLPAEDHKAVLGTKIDLDFGSIKPASLSEITNQQWAYFYDGEPRKVNLWQMMMAIVQQGRVRYRVATAMDLLKREFSVNGRFYQESVVVYLNGQALFKELGDFITLDDSTIRITKENVNELTEHDKVVVSAIYTRDNY